MSGPAPVQAFPPPFAPAPAPAPAPAAPAAAPAAPAPLQASSTQPHIVPQPIFIPFIHIVQGVLAVVIIGLVGNTLQGGYSSSYYPFTGLGVWAAVYTLLAVAYLAVTPLFLHILYNRWAVVGLLSFGVLWWVIAFPGMAHEAAENVLSYNPYSLSFGCSLISCSFGSFGTSDSTVQKRETYISNYTKTYIAAASLGGLEFVLFVVCLVFYSLALHRHFTSGAPAMSGHPFHAPKPAAAAAAPAAGGAAAVAATDVEKQNNPYVQQQAVPLQQQPVPAYPQQAQQPQQYAAPQQAHYTQPETASPQQYPPQQYPAQQYAAQHYPQQYPQQYPPQQQHALPPDQAMPVPHPGA